MNIALILAGGSGQRMGQDVPKQFLCIDNKPVIIYTLENFQKCPFIDEICVACSEGWEAFVHAYAKQFNITKLNILTLGGENRFMSVYNLLTALKGHAADDDIIMTYDAVRPIINDEIIEDSIKKVREVGAAVGVIPCYDSMYTTITDDNILTGSYNRSLINRGIGPDATTYKTAFDLFEEYVCKNTGINMIEMFMEKGIPVAKSKSSQRCIKLTTVEDIELFRAMLKYEKYDWLK